MKRRILLAAIAASPAIALFGCSKNDSSSAQKTIKLGTLSGPHAEVAEEAKKVAAKKGLNVQIIEFSDYGQVNLSSLLNVSSTGTPFFSNPLIF